MPSACFNLAKTEPECCLSCHQEHFWALHKPWRHLSHSQPCQGAAGRLVPTARCVGNRGPGFPGLTFFFKKIQTHRRYENTAAPAMAAVRAQQWPVLPVSPPASTLVNLASWRRGLHTGTSRNGNSASM